MCMQATDKQIDNCEDRQRRRDWREIYGRLGGDIDRE